MNELNRARCERRQEITEELIGLLREEGMHWRNVEGYLLGAVDYFRDKEEHPEDYEFDLDDVPDDTTQVIELFPASIDAADCGGSAHD